MCSLANYPLTFLNTLWDFCWILFHLLYFCIHFPTSSFTSTDLSTTCMSSAVFMSWSTLHVELSIAKLILTASTTRAVAGYTFLLLLQTWRTFAQTNLYQPPLVLQHASLHVTMDNVAWQPIHPKWLRQTSMRLNLVWTLIRNHARNICPVRPFRDWRLLVVLPLIGPR